MEVSSVSIDALPNNRSFNNTNENNHRLDIANNEFHKTFNEIVDNFSINDCKSFLFLLMDKLKGVDEFLALSKTEKPHIITKIKGMQLDEEILIELLGTLKMYKELKLFKTCSHIFKIKAQNFQNIRKIWKLFYEICEEISVKDLKKLLICIPEIYRSQIHSAEEWFAVALKHKIISETDVSYLKDIFQDNYTCLSIINDFQCPKIQSYLIKQPTPDSHCGVALILNFEAFQSFAVENQLSYRTGSTTDVDALKDLWYSFGFQTIVWNNLTKQETLFKVKSLALEDHSRYDAFVCCVLSHGNENVFYAIDNKEIYIKELIANFCENCASLRNKPKLFFIQACQGTKLLLDDRHSFYDYNKYELLRNSDLSTSTSEMDIVAVIASINGFVSFRHPQEGSLFVQSLCKIMKMYGENFSMLDLITQVILDVTSKKLSLGHGKPNATQIPPIYSTLRKALTLKKREC